MKNYQKVNLITGWITFIVASIVYLLTIEPTTSLWDCGEFIASAYKLEVGHPPGAPFYMILARFFSLFTTDVTQVAKLINSLSALASAFTIMFLFWTITHLGKKIILREGPLTLEKGLIVIGSGLVGSLAYTFSDTFWFSAVEGEVYALSSLFTAIVFWAILKWENAADEKYANRWLILIAYLMGLSIGVHLLNLLAIPAIVFVYYFKKYKVTRGGIIKALLVSVVLLASIMYGIIPGIVKVASRFELFFVNSLGFGYKTGVLIYAVLLLACLTAGIYYTFKKKKHVLNEILVFFSVLLVGIPFMSDSAILNIIILITIFGLIHYIRENREILNTIVLALAVIVIGYSSFSMIVIRSLADPPMDENNPDDVFSLLSYLNREQYGDRPLFVGQYFNAPVENVKQGKPVYIQKDDKYIISHHKPEYVYDQRFTTFFPRMYSSDRNHVDAYKDWGNIKGTPIRVNRRNNETETLNKPTFGENLKFFFKYQLGFMYGRYFMWNFAGRQNDTQGHGGILKGNWISGINFLDSARLGDQSNLPKSIENEESRNKYYLLPLLLGLLGLLFQWQKHKKDFSVVMFLFILTGIAIVIYLNQTPYQPRERDYAYAGSFYAFTIWIGLGAMAVYDALRSKLSGNVSAVLSTLLCLGLVPGIMASQNWNDHDRSGRYTARDLAHNYLETCAPNAIIFTIGDNDTFPLWYAQEVEGIRTDVRVCNLMLFNTDWYIDQMKRKAYESDPLPISMESDDYVQGNRDIVYVIEKIRDYVNLDDVVEFVKNDDSRTKVPLQSGERIDFIPTKKLKLKVDREKVLQNGTVLPEDSSKIEAEIKWKLNSNHVSKSQLMVLDLLANNNWERPLYFTTTGHEGSMGLENYFQLEGFAYRLVPIETTGKDMLNKGYVKTDIMYKNMMEKFKWGGMGDPDVYIDYYNHRTYSVIKIRNKFRRLAEKMYMEGKKDSATAVLDRCMSLMPHHQTPFDFYVLGIIELYYKMDQLEKANEYTIQFYEYSKENLEYYLSLDQKFIESISYEIKVSLQMLNELAQSSKPYNQELGGEIEESFNNLFTIYQGPGNF